MGNRKWGFKKDLKRKKGTDLFLRRYIRPLFPYILYPISYILYPISHFPYPISHLLHPTHKRQLLRRAKAVLHEKIQDVEMIGTHFGADLFQSQAGEVRQ